MIGKLTGRIDGYGPDWVTIDVAGVGYHVSCSAKTMAALPPEGEAAEVFTEMLVSQDMIRLIGFATDLERQWFRLLQTVQGVGARVALSVLSAFSSAELANAVALQDKTMITRAQGVGKKVAERVVADGKAHHVSTNGAYSSTVHRYTDGANGSSTGEHAASPQAMSAAAGGS